MDSLENHGIILRELRRLAGLSVQQTAIKIGKSSGWLCEVENGSGRCRLTSMEFDRIVQTLDGVQYRPMFRTWVANHKNEERVDKTFDGAILKFIRRKKELSLQAAARLAGLSCSYLCKLENGTKPTSLDLRNRIMTAYGYSPSSFKNFATDPIRSKVVPKEYKFKILKRLLSDERLDEVYSLALSTKLLRRIYV